MSPLQTELRAQVGQISGSPVLDAEWHYLMNAEHLQEARNGPTPREDLAHALEAGRAYARALAVGTPEERPLPEPTDAGRPRPMSAQEEALAQLLSLAASDREDVTAFRQDVLHGRLLCPTEAAGWVSRQDQPSGDVIGPITLAWKESPPDRLRDTPPEEGLEYTTHRTVPGQSEGDAPNRVAHLRPAPTSPALRQLARLSAALAADYPWQRAHATDFVLTGETPPVRMIRTSYRPAPDAAPRAVARLVMSVDPMTPPSLVEAEFLRARGRVVDAKRVRPPTEKSLALARFVGTRPEETWPASMATWNTAAPDDWRFKDWRSFRRACNEAYARLLDPPIRGRLQLL